LAGRWVHEFLGALPPVETEATCDACAMAPGPDEPRDAGHGRFFDAELKCCTYLPVLANFQVGAVLEDRSHGTSEGRATVLARIARKAGATPAGLDVPAPYRLLHGESAARGGAAFGRAHALRCPHLGRDGRCGIWRHRNGRCTTWFCKHVRGRVGAAFWQTLDHLLQTAERALALHCVAEVGIGSAASMRLLDRERAALTPGDIDGAPEPASYREAWGPWAGREEAFYRRCARVVEPLGWSEILALGGPQLRLLAEATREAFARLRSDEIPGALRMGTSHLLHADANAATVATYSPNDPLDLPRPLFEALHTFDGRTTRDARIALERERNLTLSDALVRRLVDFDVLVAAPAPEPRSRGPGRAGRRRPQRRPKRAR
jgi:hypothetical protein